MIFLHYFLQDALFLNPQPSTSKLASSIISSNIKQKLSKSQISSSSTVTSSQDISANSSPSANSPPPPKRQCKPERLDTELPRLRQIKDDLMTVNPFALQTDTRDEIEVSKTSIQPKMELPDYLSDEDLREENTPPFYTRGDVTELPGN